MRWRGSLVVVCGLVSGCLVSFDGYRGGLETGGTGQGATAGDVSGGKASGGKASGGESTGGSDTEAGEPSVEGGDGGSGVTGGSAGNPPAGSDPGGSAGSGGTAGSASGSGGGGNGGSGGSPPKTCPINLAGPLMVEVPKTGGDFFCMDRTEVTNAQYATFLATNPAGTNLAACTNDASLNPDVSNACATELGRYDPAVRPQVPVSCVDWCDAYTYCAWAGKRLCGAIAGGANPPASFADAEASQWFRACSKAGTQKFPYGNTYQSQFCVGLDNSGTHPSDVTSEAACQGGYNGLYDLSGNVAEWENSCSAATGLSDACLTRGGSIQSVESVPPSLLCNDSALNDTTPMPASAQRSTHDELIGFRCCYDP